MPQDKGETPQTHDLPPENPRDPIGELGISPGKSAFEIYRPSVHEQHSGHPEFKVTLLGDTWAEVEEALRQAGVMSGHAETTPKPIGELGNRLDGEWNDTWTPPPGAGPGAWDGPFTVDKCQVYAEGGEDYDGAAAFGADGQPFCLVADDLCVGGNPGAIARATRIAESLNRDQRLFERRLAEPDDQPVWQDESGDPFPWMVESRGINVPHFVVTITGECWWDIERNLVDARKRLHFTAPPQERQLPPPRPDDLRYAEQVDQVWERLTENSGNVIHETTITRAQLADAMLDAALLAIELGRVPLHQTSA